MNAFERFGLSPCPRVDKDALKKLFLEQSAKDHPDVSQSVGENTFASWNQAYQVLLSDRLRLKHLLELSGVADPGSISAVPRHLGDFFMKAGSLLHAADRLLQQKREAETFLEKAALQGELLQKSEQLQELLDELQLPRSEAQARLEQLGQEWGGQPEQIEQLKGLYQEIAYLDRWIEQIREKVFLLVIV